MAPSTKLVPAAKLITLAAKHVGESYILGTLVPKDNPNWTGPWDCAEFTSWLVFQTAGILFGCNRNFGDPSTADAYSGFWERDAKAIGQIISVEQATATAGAFILRFPVPGGIGHVVLSDGTGGTIEAHGHADGVIRNVVTGRRWDTGLLLANYSYAAAAPTPTLPPIGRILRLTTPPMSGADVTALQNALTAAGFNAGTPDGTFGPHTSAAVIAFQLSNGLSSDGEAGPITLAALGL